MIHSGIISSMNPEERDNLHTDLKQVNEIREIEEFAILDLNKTLIQHFGEDIRDSADESKHTKIARQYRDSDLDVSSSDEDDELFGKDESGNDEDEDSIGNVFDQPLDEILNVSNISIARSSEIFHNSSIDTCTRSSSIQENEKKASKYIDLTDKIPDYKKRSAILEDKKPSAILEDTKPAAINPTTQLWYV